MWRAFLCRVLHLHPAFSSTSTEMQISPEWLRVHTGNWECCVEWLLSTWLIRFFHRIMKCYKSHSAPEKLLNLGSWKISIFQITQTLKCQWNPIKRIWIRQNLPSQEFYITGKFRKKYKISTFSQIIVFDMWVAPKQVKPISTKNTKYWLSTVAHASSPSTVEGWGGQIVMSGVWDQTGQHGKTPSLLKYKN